MADKLEWICPNCDGLQYTYSLILTIKKESLKLYICSKCSIVFTDPDKFNLVTELDYDKQSIETTKSIKDGKRK